MVVVIVLVRSVRYQTRVRWARHPERASAGAHFQRLARDFAPPTPAPIGEHVARAADDEFVI